MDPVQAVTLAVVFVVALVALLAAQAVAVLAMAAVVGLYLWGVDQVVRLLHPRP